MSHRFFAIGDIHGCAAELEALLDALPLTSGDTMLFVGDYIDRGPESRRVIELMLELERRPDIATVFLKGNHEDMALAFLGRPGRYGDAWMPNGGAATLHSYGIDARLEPRAVRAQLPEEPLAFLDRLRCWHVAGNFLFVHAGIRPGRTLAEQDEEDLLWIRDPFLHRPHELPQTVVFGHTPQREVLVDTPYKIGIDTGCTYGGHLTALEPFEQRLWQVRYGERQVRERPLPPPRPRS